MSMVPAPLNQACGPATPCPSPFVCGKEGDGKGQCVLSCPTNGPGEANGCPSGAFCYVYDRTMGHYCTRICNTDADCKSVNPSLRCTERTSTELWVLKICVP